tara:strand:+ start:204 stop:491 length:288 start_codon:yes stop_codon:yes gene_type:complete
MPNKTFGLIGDFRMKKLKEELDKTNNETLMGSAFNINESCKELYRAISQLDQDSITNVLDIDENIINLVVTFGQMNNLKRADEIKEISNRWFLRL